MKTILFFLFFSVIIISAQAQDHFVKLNGDTVKCHITFVNESTIFYNTTGKEIGDKSIPLTMVRSYLVAGQQKAITKTDSSSVAIAKANTTFSISQDAGYELSKARNHFYTGAGILLSGIAIATFAPTALKKNSDFKNYQNIAILGGIVSMGGVALMMESFSHIGMAGDILRKTANINLGPGYISIAYNF